MTENSNIPGQPSAPEGGMKRQLSQAVAWNAVFTPIKFLVDTFANLIKVNLLAPIEIGAISVVSSVASTAGTWLDLGMEQALPKFIPEAEHAGGRGAARSFLRRIISIKMLILLVALLLLPLWGGFIINLIQSDAEQQAENLGQDVVASLLGQIEQYSWAFLGAIAGLIILGALYDTLLSYLVSFFRQKAWNIINLFATLALPILTVLAVLFGWGVLGVLAAMVVTAVLSVLITWMHVRRISADRADEPEAQSIPRELWRRFIPYTAMGFLIGGTEYFSSQYFAAIYLSTTSIEAVAIFWVAYNFVKQIQGYIYTPLKGIQVPLFSRVRAEGNHNLQRVFSTLSRLILILVIPSSIGLALLFPNLILVQFLKPEYVDSISIGLILIPFFFTEPFWGLGHNLLMVHEEYKTVIISRMFAMISIPLMLILPPRVGLVGIGVAIGLSKMAAGLLVISTAMRRYNIRFPWMFALKTLTAGGVMGAVIALGIWWLGVIPLGSSIGTRVAYFGGCVALTLIGVVIFIAMARLLKLIDDEERALLNELRNPLVRKIARIL